MLAGQAGGVTGLASRGDGRYLLSNGKVVAVERLMGLVLVSVAIEMLLRGIKTFVQQIGT